MDVDKAWDTIRNQPQESPENKGLDAGSPLSVPHLLGSTQLQREIAGLKEHRESNGENQPSHCHSTFNMGTETDLHDLTCNSMLKRKKMSQAPVEADSARLMDAAQVTETKERSEREKSTEESSLTICNMRDPLMGDSCIRRQI